MYDNTENEKRKKHSVYKIKEGPVGEPIKKTASRSRAYSCLPSVVCRWEETMDGILFEKGYRLRPGGPLKKSLLLMRRFIPMNRHYIAY